MNCVYCEKKATTNDHIPPKGLFSKPYPENMITVPCCSDCNNLFSKDDQYFVTMLSLRDDVKNNPTIIANMPKIKRTFQRIEATGFTNKIRSGLHKRNIITHSGLLIPNMDAMYYDDKRILKVVDRILHGLIIGIFNDYDKKQTVIIPIERIKSTDLKGMNFVFNQLLPAVEKKDVFIVGNGDVFAFQVVRPANNTKSYLWKMYFYKVVVYLGIAIPEVIKTTNSVL